MRISTQLQFMNLERSILQSTERLTDLQRQVVTGHRIEQPSDDPAGTVQSLALRGLLSQQEQYQENIREAKLFLQFTEEAVGELNALLQQARGLVLRAANDTLSQEARNGIAIQVGEILKRVHQIANQKVDDDRYLFAGQKLTSRPFDLNGEDLVYNGDDSALTAKVAPDRLIEMNLPGSPILALYETLKQVKLDIEMGNLSRLANEDLSDLQIQQDLVLRSWGEVGVRLNELDRYFTLYEARKEQLSDLLANNEEVDLPTAISELRQSELTYQAALQVAARLQGISLLDFLRGG